MHNRYAKQLKIRRIIIRRKIPAVFNITILFNGKRAYLQIILNLYFLEMKKILQDIVINMLKAFYNISFFKSVNLKQFEKINFFH